jgi:MoxR-like ATPase
MKTVQTLSDRLIENIEKVIVGKRDAVRLIVTGLLSGGHVLVEDVPGVGKTMLSRSLARSLGCTFRRIQCTPDMLPSDVTGVYIYNQADKAFEFQPGPVIAQIVLADEINRATPKTQAALLEAMQERQVTVNGITHILPEPFMVLATQNPIEYEGTFPLPEAQLDRFILRVHIGYPELEDEIKILDKQKLTHPFENLKAVASADDIVAAQHQVREVFLAPDVKRYVVEIVRATRDHQGVYLGASPRAALMLMRAGQAWAAMNEGRDYVLPDDIKRLAPSVLGHRVILSSSARLRDMKARDVVQEVIKTVPILGGQAKAYQPRT